MIKVSRLNKVEKFWINEDKIEFIEETPDTILSIEGGKKIPVAESAEEVVRMIVERKKEVYGRFVQQS